MYYVSYVSYVLSKVCYVMYVMSDMFVDTVCYIYYMYRESMHEWIKQFNSELTNQSPFEELFHEWTDRQMNR